MVEAAKMTPEEYYKILEKVAVRKGWHLNPDEELVLELAEGLLKNKERYGYASCPCRPATGDVKKDKPIICPCVYAEDDIKEYGRCFCGLYVSKEVVEGKVTPPAAIPDRHFERYLED